MYFLLVEDDPILGESLKVALELDGNRVDWAVSLRRAIQLVDSSSYDLVFLDVGLPDGNGLEFLKYLNKIGKKTPTIILTAKTDEDSVVEGLQAGAKDYVRKPFGVRELLARIKTVLNEPHPNDTLIRFGDLKILIQNREAMYRDQLLDLNRREFDIMNRLVASGGTVVTRESFMSELDKTGEAYDRILDSHISHVRTKLKKLKADSIAITSVYGVGYRLEKK